MGLDFITPGVHCQNTKLIYSPVTRNVIFQDVELNQGGSCGFSGAVFLRGVLKRLRSHLSAWWPEKQLFSTAQRQGLFWLDSVCLIKHWSGPVVLREGRVLSISRDSRGNKADLQKAVGLTLLRFSFFRFPPYFLRFRQEICFRRPGGEAHGITETQEWK